MRAPACLLILFLTLGPAAQAKDVNLGECLAPLIAEFNHGSENSDLDCSQIVAGLEAGDRIQFSNGRKFILGEKIHFDRFTNATLWADSTNPKQVIRIPTGSLNNIYFMYTYLKGWRELKDSGVPLVKILDPRNNSLEYQLVERLDIKFTFIELANWVRSRRRQPKTFRGIPWEDIKSSLIAFARQSYRIQYFKDGLQMGYVNGKWILFDFTDRNLPFVQGDIFESNWRDYEYQFPLVRELHDRVLSLRFKDCDVLLKGSTR